MRGSRVVSDYQLTATSNSDENFTAEFFAGERCVGSIHQVAPLDYRNPH